MKLLSTTDYVLRIRGMLTTEFCEAYPNDTKLPTWKGDVKQASNEFITLDAIKWRLVGEYAKFLKQPLELGMFIPCEDGKPLREPSKFDFEITGNIKCRGWDYIDYEGYRYWYEYKTARHEVDKCLATKDPNQYCNGFYLYSRKDPGDGRAFVVVKTNNPDWNI